ncbi:bifunctional tRNA (5-methylaminomethyl-2-thiouridine)(34)-methyltransferase MnmD/FAD-dependent 5-carboxymethylaminomethyl-2-thiouridine(34) oxidoreductase MnmC [Chitiniphilus shinanonensis]|uniref:bifunctional tRNA (5-methylaminomethyl-2-thiouridine)(34)-methyltransferase MnmD/FAD-dependent 5-carboxymethylaminomethyl-2-thiouridine(34) oxidoreductase MnmC n=1 Tax=Chitiniphilus shinanonensis TaxID=553088 RepID=UPI00305291C8
MNSIVPATLALSADGVPYSAAFDDVYHSSDGGLGQARHVFMAGNDLPHAWAGQSCFTIVETGFGQGLNFLATWQAWRADPQRCERLHFVSLEQFPFRRDDLAVLHARYPELAELSAALRAAWPALTPGLHRLWLDDGRVTLTLALGDARALLSQLDARADAIYLDGFSPAKNPELWQLPIYKALWRLSHAGTTLATYTVAGEVRRGLTEAGFAVRKAEGFGGKRQMLRGGVARAPRRTMPHAGERSALVVGAGLAGCAVAERLAARGWQVMLLEAESDLAQRSSGNHAGLMHPYYSRDDNLLSRLTRAGCALALRHFAALTAAGLPLRYAVEGILQLAKHDAQQQLMAELAKQGGWPDLAFLPPEAASARAGTALPRGGWWFADGATVSPPSLCRANLLRHPRHITLRTGTEVAALRHETDHWLALDASGRPLARAGIAILANASAAAHLPQAAGLPLHDAARVATVLAQSELAVPRIAIAGDGYVTGALDGARVIGAASLTDTLAQAETANLDALRTLVPGLPPPHPLSSRACLRPTAPDRLPLIGALPLAEQSAACHQLRQIARHPGLYAALAFGSRGLTWATLAGELLASHLDGEPAPLEQPLLDAVDPARFLLRALRSAR